MVDDDRIERTRWGTMADDSIDQNLGISRRDLIKRGAIIGGTLMWAAPVIQSVSSPAFGAARSVLNGCGQHSLPAKHTLRPI